jgi:hypothetical protein
MTIKRYENRRTTVNSSDNFEDQFRSRSINSIKHFTTIKLSYPSSEEMVKLEILTETWKLGDRLYKYAYKHYGDPSLWWVIAWFNKKPTENEYELGEEVLIPFPLEKIFKYFGD